MFLFAFPVVRFPFVWLSFFGLVVLVSACTFRSSEDCIRLTPSSRRCSNPHLFAEPPPPAPTPIVSAETSSGWVLTTAERPVVGDSALNETVWTTRRPPFGAHDFIALRRIAALREETNTASRPQLLFLPGPHLHGEILLPSEQLDLRLYLAKRGIDTWTVDYRTHFVSREQIIDSSFMQAWTTEAFVADVVSAIQRMRETNGQTKIFISGFGLGATFAALAAARIKGEGIAGIILLDGYLLTPPDLDPLYRERTPTPNWFADDLESHFLPYKRWIKILQDVLDDPSGPDFLPTPIFDNRAQALAHFLYMNANFGGQGGLSNVQNGWADIRALARVLQSQDRYWPRVQNHGGFDPSRHLTGAQFDYMSAFQSLQVPMLAFASGNMDKAGIAWSERVQYTAQAIATVDTESHVLQDWGHLDILLGSAAADKVFSPLAEWISRH